MKPEGFCDLIKGHLAKYKREILNETEDGVFKRNGRKYGHILPEQKRELNILPPFRDSFWKFYRKSRIKLHQDFHHLNSSQALCFNLFFPLRIDPQTQCTFLHLLGCGKEEQIAEFEFEKVFKNEPWHNGLPENTNFDGYLKLASGNELFFELKFSEQDFGTCKADARHLNKLAKIYNQRLQPVLRPEFLVETTFCQNYQLFRNISYLAAESGSRLFLVFPQTNDKLSGIRSTLDSAVLPKMRSRISILPLEDLVDRIIQSDICSHPLLREHYSSFEEKYLPA